MALEPLHVLTHTVDFTEDELIFYNVIIDRANERLDAMEELSKKNKKKYFEAWAAVLVELLRCRYAKKERRKDRKTERKNILIEIGKLVIIHI